MFSRGISGISQGAITIAEREKKTKRKKEVYHASELVHVWARQTQEYGRNSHGNFYFRGSEIYSYGSHFCIAKIIKKPKADGTGGVVLVTTRTYSNTTSAQVWATKAAVRHMKNVECYYPEDENPGRNYKEFAEQIKSHLSVIESAGKIRQNTKDQSVAVLPLIIKDVKEYLKYTSNKITKEIGYRDDYRKDLLAAMQKARKYPLTQEIKDRMAEYSARQAEVSKARSAKLDALRAERNAIWEKQRSESEARKERLRALYAENPEAVLDLWRNGQKFESEMEITFDRWNSVIKLNEGNALLRLSDDVIETSMGARVSVDEGRLLLSMIRAGKDVKGHNIGGYTVIGLNGVLKVGCHEIPRAEIERFAKSQGW